MRTSALLPATYIEFEDGSADVGITHASEKITSSSTIEQTPVQTETSGA